MDNVPPEIHMKIYRYACKDDGSTGTSLSSVSKYVRQISAEYRYQSIAVCGPVAIARLLQALCDVPEHLRRIHFLFIYDLSLKEPEIGAASSEWFNMGSFMSISRWGHDLMGGNISEDVVGRNIVKLLQLAQATIEVLSLVSFEPHLREGSFISLLRGQFPNLSDLTVRGPHQLPLDPSFAPILHRLHLSDVAIPSGFAFTVAINHPSLSRVRISRLLDIGGHMTDLFGLMHAMRIVSVPEAFKSEEPPHAMESGVKRVLLVELGPSTSQSTNTRHLLWAHIQKRSTSKCEGLHLLPDHPGHGRTKEANMARKDWLMCINGLPMEWGNVPGELGWNSNLSI